MITRSEFRYPQEVILGLVVIALFLIFDLIIIWIPGSCLCWRVARTVIHVVLHGLTFAGLIYATVRMTEAEAFPKRYLALMVLVILHFTLGVLVLPSITLKARLFAPITNKLIRYLHQKLERLVDEIKELEDKAVQERELEDAVEADARSAEAADETGLMSTSYEA